MQYTLHACACACALHVHLRLGGGEDVREGDRLGVEHVRGGGELLLHAQRVLGAGVREEDVPST